MTKGKLIIKKVVEMYEEVVVAYNNQVNRFPVEERTFTLRYVDL
jgi:hypothetical protein